MTKSQLEYILAVDRERNFSNAAKACFVSQSTLSSMVSKFETQNKVVIFNRKEKPIGITKEGERILKHLKNIYREIKILDEVVNQIKGVETGNLSIAAIPTIAPYLFPKILNDVAAKFPQVKFNIHEVTTQNIIENISSGKIDIGIVAIPLEVKDLVEIPLYTESFLLYDKRELEQQTHKKKANLKDIDFSKLLLLEEGHCFRNQVEKICNLKEVEQFDNSMNYYSASIESLKKMVELNKGMTLLPFFSTLDLCNNEPCLIPFESPVPARRIGLVYHKNFVKSKLAEGIKEIILKKIEKEIIVNSQINIIKPF